MAAVEGAEELGQLGARSPAGVGVGDGQEGGVRDVARAARVAELGPLAKRAERAAVGRPPGGDGARPGDDNDAHPVRRSGAQGDGRVVGHLNRAGQPELVDLGGHPRQVGVPVDARKAEGGRRDVGHRRAGRLQRPRNGFAQRLAGAAQADHLPVCGPAGGKALHRAVGAGDDGMRLRPAAVDSEDERHPAALAPADR